MNMNEFNLYYKGLVEEEFEQSQKTGKEQLDYMENSTAGYREYQIKTLYMAKGYPKELVEYLENEGAFIHKILTKVTKEYMEKEDYRKLFSFPEKLEKLIVKHPGYDTLIPIARLDIFLNEEDYSYKFCEFNTDGASAMNEDRELNLSLKKTRGYERIARDYQIDTFELFDRWAAELKEIYSTYKDKKENPSVGIVDFTEKGCSVHEFEQFRQSFERIGFKAFICEIRDLTYDGQRLYSGEGEPLDIIYRRAVTSDIFEHLDEVKPFVQAVEDQKVCAVGNFCTQVVHDKTVFCILHHERTKQFLTEEEIAYIKEHIPFTVDLDKEQIRKNDIYAKKDKWLIKPKNSYGAKGVYAGVNFTKRKWKRLVKKHRDQNFVLQEFVMPFQSYNIDFSEETPEFRKYSNMTGLFMYGGKLAGLYSRMSKNEIISGEYGENDVASIVFL